MAKIRTKQVSGVRFIDVVQSGMEITRTVEQQLALVADPHRVKGAFVKVQPLIRSSERAAVDRKAVRDQLLAAGAVAVVVVPTVVPDSAEDLLSPARPVESRSPQSHLEQWFATVRAPRELIAVALVEAMSSIGEAGL